MGRSGLGIPPVAVVPEVVEVPEGRRNKKDKDKKEKEKKGDFSSKKGKGGKRFDDDDDFELEMRGSKNKRKGGKFKGQEAKAGPKVVVLDEATLTIQLLSEKMDVRGKAGEGHSLSLVDNQC